MYKIRSGDTVFIRTGKDKGKQGTVLQVLRGIDKVVVEGVNIAKKHVKPNPNSGVEGGIVDKAMPLALSNVGLLNPDTGKADRVGVRTEDGKKVRYFKSTNKPVV